MSVSRIAKGSRNGSYGRVVVFEVRDELGVILGYELEINGQRLEGYWFAGADALGRAFAAAEEIAKNGPGEPEVNLTPRG